MMKNCAVILASGSGSRANLDIPKQFYKINEKTILEYSLDIFQNHNEISSIIIVVNPDFYGLTEGIGNKYSKVRNIIKGGLTRQQSSYNGVNAIKSEEFDNVLIHDAVRPFVTFNIIDRCIEKLKEFLAVNVVMPVSDTIIEIDKNNIIKSVPLRCNLRKSQTPQCFRYSIIKKAHELALKENYNSATDDCSLVLRYNLAPIAIVEGSEKNIKITYQSDIEIAKKILNI